MAFAKKQGYRKITVNNEQYYWFVLTDTKRECLDLKIRMVKNPNYVIMVKTDYIDLWLQFSSKPNIAKVGSIRPKLVQEVIVFVAENNLVYTDGKAIVLGLKDEKLEIIE